MLGLETQNVHTLEVRWLAILSKLLRTLQTVWTRPDETNSRISTQIMFLVLSSFKIYCFCRKIRIQSIKLGHKRIKTVRMMAPSSRVWRGAQRLHARAHVRTANVQRTLAVTALSESESLSGVTCTVRAVLFCWLWLDWWRIDNNSTRIDDRHM